MFASLFSHGLLTSHWPVPSSGLAVQADELMPWSEKITQDSAANTPKAENLQTLPRVCGGGRVDFKKTRKKTAKTMYSIETSVVRHLLSFTIQALLHQLKENFFFFF